jgi:excisionase family DNA binding protein
MKKDKRALTTGEIANYVGVNFQTVLRWIQKGHIKAHKLPGRGDHRVTINDFLSFLEDFDLPIPEEFRTVSDCVLVVEDEPLISKLIKLTLESANYSVVTASSGFEAGTMLHEYVPSLVTLDLKMPGLDGLSVLKFIRSNDKYKDVKVLIISAHLDLDENKYLEQGANGILKKPFKNEVLLAQVNDMLSY